jgi:hypothetical protein
MTEILDSSAVEALIQDLSAIAHMAPRERPIVSPAALTRVLGQEIGLRRRGWIWADQLLELFIQGQYEDAMAARLGRQAKHAPLLARNALGEDGRPFWRDDATYRTVLNADPVPSLNKAWADRLWRDVVERQEAVGAAYQRELEDAAKAIGPALSRGVKPTELVALVAQRAPLASEADRKRVLDEEAAWWLRCRHDRGLQTLMPEAA